MGDFNLKDPSNLALFIAFIGMVGVILGAIISLASSFINEYLTRERKEIEDRKAFVERQLLEFYGPTIALCRELTAQHDLWRNTRKENAKRSAQKSEIKSVPDDSPSTVDTKRLEKGIIAKLHNICDMFTKHSGFSEDISGDDLQTLIYSTLKLEHDLESSTTRLDVYEDFYDVPDTLNFVYKNLLETEAKLKNELAGRRFSKVKELPEQEIKASIRNAKQKTKV